MTPRHLLIGVVWCFVFRSGSTTEINDVIHYTEQFAEAAEAAGDAIKALRLLAENGAEIMKAAGPVSGLIAHSLSFVVKPESNEAKAITLLGDNMRRQFSEMGRNINNGINLLMGQALSYDYKNHITANIRLLERRFSWIIAEPTATPKSKKDLYLGACIGVTTEPHQILEQLTISLVENCPIPTTRQSDNFIRSRRAFAQLEVTHQDDLNSRSLSSFHALRNRILARTYYMSEAEIEDLISQLHTLQSSASARVTSSIEKFVESHSSMKNPIGCYLAELTAAVDHVVRRVDGFLTVVTEHLRKAEFHGHACANITNNGSPVTAVAIKAATERRILIAKHVADWMEATRRETSEVAISATRELLGKDDVDISKFNETAREVQKIFNDRVRSNETFTVLVFKQDISYGKGWVMKNYARKNVTFTVNNIIIHALISEAGDSKSAGEARVFFDEIKDRVTETIFQKELGDRADLMLTEIETAVKKDLVGPLKAHYVLLVLRVKFWASSAVVHFGVGNAVEEGLNSTSSAEYFSNGSTRDARHYRFFIIA